MDSDQHTDSILAPGDSPLAGHAPTASVRSEMWRGAKFGAKVMGISMTAIMLLVWVAFLAFVGYQYFRVGSRLFPALERVSILKVFGSLIGVSFLITLYGGMMGSLIMGFAAWIRNRRVAKERTDDLG